MSPNIFAIVGKNTTQCFAMGPVLSDLIRKRDMTNLTVVTAAVGFEWKLQKDGTCMQVQVKSPWAAPRT